jgi:hypothetical protein
MKVGDLVELSAQGKKRLWLKPLARLYGVVTEFCDHRWRVQWFGKSKSGVGDLVRQKQRPQGVWLVTRIDGTGNWFAAHDYGSSNTWLRLKEYEVISGSR